jgi:hypothetical protein
MDKMHRQKVAEVEKLTQTVHELEEAVLAGGAAANAVRDYQRKVQEMNVMTLTLGIMSSSKRQLLVGLGVLGILQIASNLQTCIGREKNFRTGGSSSKG